MKYIIITLLSLFVGGNMVQAQTAPATDTLKINRDNRPGLNPGFVDGGALHKDKKKGGGAVWIGSGGIHYEKSGKHDTSYRRFEVQIGMLDLGINSLIDNTDYSLPFSQPGSPSAFLNVDPAHVNKDLFSIRQSKSINVNIYPIMFKANLLRSNKQRLMLVTGLGMQIYNFRFTKPVSYRSDPTPYVTLDTISFSKNKLAINYLTVPLMLNGKTKIASTPHSTKEGDASSSTYGKGYWLTYGVGISGGYLLSSWTKQISDQRGKDKDHDPFNFTRTNLCINGEIGLDGYVRLYASYQITKLHDSYLDQHPFCIGLRFLGL